MSANYNVKCSVEDTSVQRFFNELSILSLPDFVDYSSLALKDCFNAQIDVAGNKITVLFPNGESFTLVADKYA